VNCCENEDTDTALLFPVGKLLAAAASSVQLMYPKSKAVTYWQSELRWTSRPVISFALSQSDEIICREDTMTSRTSILWTLRVNRIHRNIEQLLCNVFYVSVQRE
jgi:hypothetical protein